MSLKEYSPTAKWSDINLFGYSVWGSLVATHMYITYPFRVIKIRMQIQGSTIAGSDKWDGRHYKRTSSAIVHILKTEGISGLFKGGFTFVTGVVFLRLLQFISYEWCKDLIIDHSRTSVIPPTLSASILSSILSSTVSVPIDVVTQRLVINVNKSKVSQEIKRIYKEFGVKGFYKAYTISLIGFIPFTTTFFAVFEFSKEQFYKREIFKENPLYSICFSGLAAGFSAASVHAPIDVLKTRMQAERVKGDYANVWKAFINTLKKEGAQAFLKGFMPRVVSLGPSATVNIILFDYAKQISLQ